MSLSQRQQEIERLEHAFWQSMLEGNTNEATGMLGEPALMVNGHGAVKFDHDGYQRMAQDDRYRLVEYTLSNMDIVFPRDDLAIATYQATQAMQMDGESLHQEAFDSSTWIRGAEGWKCIAHTESLQAPATH